MIVQSVKRKHAPDDDDADDDGRVKLKVSIPRHLAYDGRASSKKKSKKAPTDQHLIESTVRARRSEITHRGMCRSGENLVQTQIQVENLRAVISRGVSSTGHKAEGWSHPLPQWIIPRFIGRSGRQIQQLARELCVKLTVVPHDYGQCVRIEAANDLLVRNARDAIDEKVRELTK